MQERAVVHRVVRTRVNWKAIHAQPWAPVSRKELLVPVSRPAEVRHPLGNVLPTYLHELVFPAVLRRSGFQFGSFRNLLDDSNQRFRRRRLVDADRQARASVFETFEQKSGDSKYQRNLYASLSDNLHQQAVDKIFRIY